MLKSTKSYSAILELFKKKNNSSKILKRENSVDNLAKSKTLPNTKFKLGVKSNKKETKKKKSGLKKSDSFVQSSGKTIVSTLFNLVKSTSRRRNFTPPTHYYQTTIQNRRKLDDFFQSIECKDIVEEEVLLSYDEVSEMGDLEKEELEEVREVRIELNKYKFGDVNNSYLNYTEQDMKRDMKFFEMKYPRVSKSKISNDNRSNSIEQKEREEGEVMDEEMINMVNASKKYMLKLLQTSIEDDIYTQTNFNSYS